MGALFDPFKARKNAGMNLTVQVPSPLMGNGKEGDEDYVAPPKAEFELTVRKLPPALITNAVVKGEGMARERGIDESHPGFRVQAMKDFWYCLSGFMKGHVKGWKSLDGETPPFSETAFAAWLDEQHYEDRVTIGWSYMLTAADDEKKTTARTATDQDSSKPSESDSSTS